MNNTVILVGRVVEISPNINLRITIPGLNNEDVTVNIFIPAGSMKENVRAYLHDGDIVGIKGKLKEDSKNHNILVMADKLSFLSKASNEVPTDDEPSDDIDEESI